MRFSDIWIDLHFRVLFWFHFMWKMCLTFKCNFRNLVRDFYLNFCRNDVIFSKMAFCDTFTSHIILRRMVVKNYFVYCSNPKTFKNTPVNQVFSWIKSMFDQSKSFFFITIISFKCTITDNTNRVTQYSGGGFSRKF